MALLKQLHAYHSLSGPVLPSHHLLQHHHCPVARLPICFVPAASLCLPSTTTSIAAPYAAACSEAVLLPLPLPPTEGIATAYTTTSTGITFYLDTRTGFDWQAANRQCNLRGGHLAIYSSWQEQREVESFYLDNVSHRS